MQFKENNIQLKKLENCHLKVIQMHKLEKIKIVKKILNIYLIKLLVKNVL